MRRVLEAIALAAFISLIWITFDGYYGPHRLPERIPTHFGLDGQPNGWGSPRMLVMLPLIAQLIYLGMTLVTRFPSAFNYPVRVTVENRPRLEAQVFQMIAWLKTEVVCLFTFIQWCVIQSARQGRLVLSPLAVPLFIVAIFVTIGWHFVALFRAARPV